MTAALCRQLGRVRHGLTLRGTLRGVARESYGRRPELYDDDVFVPIDETPAVSRRRKVSGRSVLKLNLEIDFEKKEEREVEKEREEKAVEQERSLKLESQPKKERPREPLEASPSKVLEGAPASAVRPPPPPPQSGPQKPGLAVAPPVAPPVAPMAPEQVKQFLQQHGITLEGGGELRPLRPIRSFEEGGFPEQVRAAALAKIL